MNDNVCFIVRFIIIISTVISQDLTHASIQKVKLVFHNVCSHYGLIVKSITEECGINGCLVCELWLSDEWPNVDSRVGEGINLAVIPLSITPPCKVGNSLRTPWHSTKDFPAILLLQTTTQVDKQWINTCSFTTGY